MEICYYSECTKDGLLHCSNCRNVSYCSKEHQILDWKQAGGHRNLCKSIFEYGEKLKGAWDNREDFIFDETSCSTGDYTIGVKVVDSPGMGKVAVSTQDFNPGDSILIELPLITCKRTHRTGIASLLAAFVAATSEQRCAILDMYISPLQTLSTKEANEIHLYCAAIRLCDLTYKTVLPTSHEETFRLFEKLIYIWDTNAHSFSNPTNVEKYDKKVNLNHNCQKTSELSALFDIGSKIENSCFPNASYSSKTVVGHCVYTCKRHIKRGERVSFSYCEPYMPTTQRRQHLMDTKYFKCCCILCSSTDYCRPLFCNQTLSNCCSGIIMETGEMDDWKCNQCGPCNFSAPLITEREIDDKVHSSTNIILASLENLQLLLNVYKEVLNKVPLLHHNVYKMLQALAKHNASVAEIFIHKKKQFLQHSACSLALAILWQEIMNKVRLGLLSVSESQNYLPFFLNFPPKSSDVETYLKEMWKYSDETKSSTLTRIIDSSHQALWLFYDLMEAGMEPLAAFAGKRFLSIFQTWLPKEDPDLQILVSKTKIPN